MITRDATAMLTRPSWGRAPQVRKQRSKLRQNYNLFQTKTYLMNYLFHTLQIRSYMHVQEWRIQMYKPEAISHHRYLLNRFASKRTLPNI